MFPSSMDISEQAIAKGDEGELDEGAELIHRGGITDETFLCPP